MKGSLISSDVSDSLAKGLTDMKLNDFYNEVSKRVDTEKTSITVAETKRVLSEAFLAGCDGCRRVCRHGQQRRYTVQEEKLQLVKLIGGWLVRRSTVGRWLDYELLELPKEDPRRSRALSTL